MQPFLIEFASGRLAPHKALAGFATTRGSALLGPSVLRAIQWLHIVIKEKFVRNRSLLHRQDFLIHFVVYPVGIFPLKSILFYYAEWSN